MKHKMNLEIDIEENENKHFKGVVVTTTLSENNPSTPVFSYKYVDRSLDSTFYPELTLRNIIVDTVSRTVEAYVRYLQTNEKTVDLNKSVPKNDVCDKP